MGQFCKAIVATRIFLLWECRSQHPLPAASFDGAWSVRIASSNGACPNGTSVSIGISNGQVESGDGSFTASGHVAEAGSISVTLSSGARRAVGYGRHIGVRYLARRDVFGHLDGAKDLMASEVIRPPSLNIARRLPAPSR